MLEAQPARLQCTGHMPPSLAKWGVDRGCQSWVYTMTAPASRAEAAAGQAGKMWSAPILPDALVLTNV